MTSQTMEERLAQVARTPLSQYARNAPPSHGQFEGGDVMQAVAYVAGEPWTDRPQCACPLITDLMINWSCWLPLSRDRESLLKPLIPLIVGTRSTQATEQRRSLMAANWLVREFAPAWMAAAGLHEEVRQLQLLPELTEKAHYKSMAPTLLAIAKGADGAVDAAVQACVDSAEPSLRRLVRAAATYGVQDSALDAGVRPAAMEAVGDAAATSGNDDAPSLAKRACAAAAQLIAWEAAWEEALDVLTDVHDQYLEAATAAFEAGEDDILVWRARSAARAGVRTALRPLVTTWQRSAFSLVKRMCAT